MMLHITRSRPYILFPFRTYRLDAKLDVTPQEYAVIRAHKLHKFEIFSDPYRDHIYARADAARQRAKALPFLTATPEQHISVACETWREVALLFRARFCFRITIGNLISGISITNRRLIEISKVEHVLHESVDDIAATVAAALRYQDRYEDVHAPGQNENEAPAVSPNEWPSSW